MSEFKEWADMSLKQLDAYEKASEEDKLEIEEHWHCWNCGYIIGPTFCHVCGKCLKHCICNKID